MKRLTIFLIAVVSGVTERVDLEYLMVEVGVSRSF